MKTEKINTEVLEEYFDGLLDDAVVTDEKYALLLLMLGERPGVLVMNPDLDDRKLLRKLCEYTGLEYFYTGGEGRRGLIDRLKRTDSRLFKGGFFIAENEERFQMLKDSEGRFYGFSDRAVGEFLGYPEDDIDYFAENVVEGHIERPTREKAEQLVSEGVLDKQDLKFLELVCYVPRPEKENIVDAVEMGKLRHELLESLDDEKGTDVGRDMLRELMRDPMYLR